MIEPDRVQALPAMLCVGIRRRHAFAEAAAGIALQWQELRALGPIAGTRGDALYGIMCGADADGFEYMCGVEVDAFESAPPGLGRIRIPAQEYAVFTHRGASSELAQTWLAIWHEWIPRSGYVMALTPEFERYPDGFATDPAAPHVEIWASIRKEA